MEIPIQGFFVVNIVAVVLKLLYTFAAYLSLLIYYVCWIHSDKYQSLQLGPTKYNWKERTIDYFGEIDETGFWLGMKL